MTDKAIEALYFLMGKAVSYSKSQETSDDVKLCVDQFEVVSAALEEAKAEPREEG